MLIDPETNLPYTAGASSNGAAGGDITIEAVDTGVVFPVTDNGGSLTIDGTVAISNASFPVTDNGGSLTVDGTVAVSAISGTVTVGTHAVTQSGTWNVTNTTANGATATVTQVATSTTSATLAATNTSRKSVVIFNGATVNLLVKFGTTASSTSFTTQIIPGGTLSVPRETYTGAIDAILASGSASTAQVTVIV